jgi:hypothetical protein
MAQAEQTVRSLVFEALNNAKEGGYLCFLLENEAITIATDLNSYDADIEAALIIDPSLTVHDLVPHASGARLARGMSSSIPASIASRRLTLRAAM